MGEACVNRLVGQLLAGRLRNTKVDHLGDWQIIVHRDQYIGWLDVAMDDPLLMRMLNRLTDLHEEFESLLRCQLPLIAELGDRDATDQLHDKVRPANRGRRWGIADRSRFKVVSTSFPDCSRIQNLCDVGMVHQSQSLPLGLESRQDLATVHSQLDDL